MFKYFALAILVITWISNVALSGDYEARVDQARCSSAEAAAIRDLAFMRRIAVASPHYPFTLSDYIQNRYIPQNVRLRREPYIEAGLFTQINKALEVARSTNFLEINCRRLLAGGNGRAYDRIGSNFEVNDQDKYFDEFIQIDNDGLDLTFETDEPTRGTYLSRMGTIHHEVYHNWSYDHLPHGNSAYGNSMNQVARRALQDSFSGNWMQRTSTPGCPSLRRCRFLGYLLMRDTEGNNFVAFDPARRGFGLLGFKYPEATSGIQTHLTLQDATLTNTRVVVRTLPGEAPQASSNAWRPRTTDRVVAISKTSISGDRPPNLNEFIVQTDSDFKVVRWSGLSDQPNFSVKLTIPFNVNLPVRGSGVDSGRSINAGTQFLGYDAFQRNSFFVQTRSTEILNIASETDGAKVRYGIFSGTRLRKVNQTEEIYIDGRIRFLGQGNVLGPYSSVVLIGTESKLVLLRPTNDGPRVIATLQSEAWSGPSRWDADAAQKRPPIFADFDGDGRDEIMLTNDSGIRILKYSSGELHVIGQLQFGTRIRRFEETAFSSDMSIRKFGKFSFTEDREAVLMWGDGFMRIVSFSGDSQLVPNVFSRIGIPFDDGPVRGRSARELEARARYVEELILNGVYRQRGTSSNSWIYSARVDEPVLIHDMTGNGFAEVVIRRRAPLVPSEIRALGILKLRSDELVLTDYRYTGCFEAEACHEGTFGNWLLRKDDMPLGFLVDNASGKALLLMQNRAAQR